MESFSLQYEDQSDVFNDKFFKNINFKEMLSSDYTGLMISFEWFDFIFGTIPYINNIFNDIKSFLKDEEEILKIEKVRKVGPPTFKHLSKHTNFIQTYDEEKNRITPSKLLNSYKEDTFNTYENRFIVTLVDELAIFLEDIQKRIKNHESHSDNSFVFNSSTKADGEDIGFNFLIESKTDRSSVQEEFEQKSDIVMNNVKSWRDSMLYKQLKKERAPAVTDPLKRTNVILKNPNFQMAARLWDFIHNFKLDIDNIDNNKETFSELPKTFTDRLNNNFLCYYYIMMYTCSKSDYQRTMYNKQLNKLFLKDIKENIHSIVKSDDNLTKEDLVNLVSSEYDVVKKEKVIDYSMVANKINSNLKKFVTKVDSSFFQIGGEGAEINFDEEEEKEEVTENEEEIKVDDIDTTKRRQEENLELKEKTGDETDG